MIGAGVAQSTEKTIRNYSKPSSLKLSNMKVHTFLIFLHRLSTESAIMGFKEEEIHISGRFGQEEQSSSHISRMSAISTASLVLKPYQFGKLSSRLSIAILLINQQLCFFMRDTTVDSAPSETI
jgi:hypothetical protein